MSRSDAYIRVSCDSCGDEVDVHLCWRNDGNWDDFYLTPTLEKMGWRSMDFKDYCKKCVEMEDKQ